MSDTAASLRRKIAGAGDLQSVVRTMKALAAANIGQYEQSARALAGYYRCIELGLGVCFRHGNPAVWSENGKAQADADVSTAVCAIVFGTDQGLVGRFNEVVAEHALKTLAALPGEHQVWAIGQRVHARLADAGLPPAGLFNLPNSVRAITPLVGRILLEAETFLAQGDSAELRLFYNLPDSVAAYAPVGQRLLPLDNTWRLKLMDQAWPTKQLPELVGNSTASLRAILREYLFVSIFRACAESLASENASRLAAMQRADKNIDELLADLNVAFHRLRQSSIDEELFDVISGFEALTGDR